MCTPHPKKKKKQLQLYKHIRMFKINKISRTIVQRDQQIYREKQGKTKITDALHGLLKPA